MRAKWLLPAAAALAAIALGSCGGGGSDRAGSDAGRAARERSERSAEAATAPRSCHGGAKTTPEQTEGPYYKPGAPRRSVLSGPGDPLVLRGRVLSPGCRPLARARLDFWQADGNGRYDNRGFRMRGYQLSDARGRYRLRTVLPGEYPGRTPHIHVKLTPRGGPTLTTQLYLPGRPTNAADPIFDPATVVRLRRARGGWQAQFDFVAARR